MSSSLIGIIIFIASVIDILLAVYAAYWAFKIGRALFVRLYKSQAFGIGFVAVYMLALFLLLGPIQTALPASFGGLTLLLPAVWIGSLVLLFWIDSSARAGRRADPLLRDTANWMKLRFFIWGIVLLAIFSGVLIALLSFFRIISTGASGSGLPIEIGFFVVFGPIFVTGIVGGLILPKVASRSKDISFREHFKWFGIFFSVLVAGVAGSIFVDEVLHLDGGIVLAPLSILEIYCLYRSVKSLVPLNKIELVENRKR